MSSPSSATRFVSTPTEDAFREGQTEDVLRLTGVELAVCVATEVMDWRLDRGGNKGGWVTAQDSPAGYYFGRPFRPHRDRNALAEVLVRVEKLGLCDDYMNQLLELISLVESPAEQNGLWTFHVVDPRLACCAALMAIRSAQLKQLGAVA